MSVFPVFPGNMAAACDMGWGRVTQQQTQTALKKQSDILFLHGEKLPKLFYGLSIMVGE